MGEINRKISGPKANHIKNTFPSVGSKGKEKAGKFAHKKIKQLAKDAKGKLLAKLAKKEPRQFKDWKPDYSKLENIKVDKVNPSDLTFKGKAIIVSSVEGKSIQELEEDLYLIELGIQEVRGNTRDQRALQGYKQLLREEALVKAQLAKLKKGNG